MPREALSTAYVVTRRWPRAVDEAVLRPVGDQTALVHRSFELASAALAESTSARQSQGLRIEAPLHALRTRPEGAKAWVRPRKTALFFAG